MNQEPTRETPVFPPVFATNNPETQETVAEQIRILIDGSLRELRTPPNMAIASAYINVAGFSLIADQLEAIPRVRLLLGAEPEAGVGPVEVADYLYDHDWLAEVLASHDNWLSAERDLTAFTLADDRNVRRLVAWLTSTDGEGFLRVEVRRFAKGFLHGKAFIVDHSTHAAVLAGSSNLTYAGLMTNRELNLGYPNTASTHLVQNWFNELWEESEIYGLADLYAAKWEEHSPYLIFMRMLSLLYGDQEADLALETKLELTGFQRDGVARALRLVDANGGVLICDEVGLGKTFIAGEICRRAIDVDRQRVLILCPAAVKETVWEKFLDERFPRRHATVLSYDELRNRIEDEADGGEFRRTLDDYALVVIDEAHNLRNVSTQRSKVVNELLGGKFPKKTVLLTATPVNNSLMDLQVLVSYFIKNDGAFASIGIPSIRGYIADAKRLDPESLSPQHLFDLMDQVAVRRTRRFVKRNYRSDTFRSPSGAMVPIKFPTHRVKRLDYGTTELGAELLRRVLDAIMIRDDDDLVLTFSNRHIRPDRLMLARYATSAYLKSGEIESFQVANSGLLRSALLKRLESSPKALASTLATMVGSHNAFLSALDQGYVLSGEALAEWSSSLGDDLEEVLAELDNEKSGTQVLRAEAFHVRELREDIEADRQLLIELQALAEKVASDGDKKAERFIDEIREIARQAEATDKSGLSASDRRKTVIFSTFTDTISDLHDKVNRAIELALPSDPISHFRGRICDPIYGAKGGTDQQLRAREIMRFAPRTAGTLTDQGLPTTDDRYDLLFTTDVLSEGVNLQQAGRMINYDLPWNPMRLVQRAGRIDRIGSNHDYITIGCFFPEAKLDELLHLEATLIRKLAYADAAIGTGEILPGQKSKADVVLTDTREQIDALRSEKPDIFEGEGDLGAISGEEFRRRLFQATHENSYFQEKLSRLPFGSGSGFISSSAKTNGYVFCIKMGKQEKPWFRFVPTDENWNPIAVIHETGPQGFEISEDTLTALSNADPGSEQTPRVLTPLIYEKAFLAWEFATLHAYNAWSYLTNPNNLRPELDRAFRDATELVLDNGAFLGPDAQQELAERLSGRWGFDVKKAVRQVLNDESSTPRTKIERLIVLADEFGLRIPKPAQPLPVISKEEVRLVAWIAISRKS